MSNRAIAVQMGITEGTVRTHVTHLLGKLHVSSRTQAVLAAINRGLIDPGGVDFKIESAPLNPNGDY